MNPDECKQVLLAGIEKTDPIFNSLGFVFEISGVGSSSEGPFASGFYSKDNKEIWLIYRDRAGLGAIIYQYHQIGIIHEDVMNYLKKSDVSKLKYSGRKFASFPKEEETHLKHSLMIFRISLLSSLIVLQQNSKAFSNKYHWQKKQMQFASIIQVLGNAQFH